MIFPDSPLNAYNFRQSIIIRSFYLTLWLMDLICHDSTDCRSMLLHKQIAYPVMPNLEFSNFKRFQSSMLSLFPLSSTFWFFPVMAKNLLEFSPTTSTVELVIADDPSRVSLARYRKRLLSKHLPLFAVEAQTQSLGFAVVLVPFWRSSSGTSNFGALGSVRLWWGRGGCKVLCVKGRPCRQWSREANLLAIKDWVQSVGFVYLCLWQGIKLDLLGRHLLETWTLQSEKSFWGKLRKKVSFIP